MYKAFFKLARNPFDLTPDPTGFVPTSRHSEALAALHCGILRHKGDIFTNACRSRVGIWIRTLIFSELTHRGSISPSTRLARLIDTTCENAFIPAHARRLPTVPPDVIEDVAREFRLEVVCSPQARKNGSSDESDAQRITNVLNELYAALQRPVAGDPDLAGISRRSERP